MPYHYCLENDFTRYVNNLSSVTLKVYGNPDQHLNKVVMTQPVQWRELSPTDGQVIRRGTKFIWPRKYAAVPPIGAIIVDRQGTYWTVWRELYKEIVHSVEVDCLNLSIVIAPNGLNPNENIATVLKSRYGKGEANEARVDWLGYFTGHDPAITNPNTTPNDLIPARFQPSMESARLAFGAESSSEIYRVYFQPPLPQNFLELAGGEYRLVSPAGHRFRVLKFYQEEEIAQLPCAIAEKITAGDEYFLSNPTPGP